MAENVHRQTSRSFARWETKDDPHFVYELKDIKGRLLYVGCSINPGRRLLTHATKPWWKLVTDVAMTRYPDRNSALFVERTMIREHLPPYNVMSVPWEELQRRFLEDA
ncbi:MAG: GIY-YIG nuclease family protein [Mycobacteriaceae bacterium]